MRADKYLAFSLRKLGKSYKEIRRELRIPLSTLNFWFKDQEWSMTIKESLVIKNQNSAKNKLRLMSKANKLRWEAWHQECRNNAKIQFTSLKDDHLFTAGLMLYWGEGDKTMKNCTVRLVNSDPDLIKVFFIFLNRSLGISKEKIIIKLTLYPEIDDSACRSFWSNFLMVPLEQFRKSVVIQGRHPTRTLPNGICSVEVYSRELKEKIFT